MFGFGSGQISGSRSHNHSAAQQTIQAGGGAHKKNQIPAEMSNAFKRLTSFYGRGVTPADGKTTINQYVKNFSDAKSWAVAGFYNPSKFEQTKSLKDFVACAACGQEYKLFYRGKVGTPQEIASCHDKQQPTCNRTQIAAQSEAEAQINTELPKSHTTPESYMQGSQPSQSQSFSTYRSYPSQSGGGRPY